jgi:hypothetical protein
MSADGTSILNMGISPEELKIAASTNTVFSVTLWTNLNKANCILFQTKESR